MDFIWDFIDQFQRTAAFAMLQKLSPLDWIVVFAVLWGMLRGSREGCSGMLGKVFQIVLVGVLVLSFYQRLADYIGNYLRMMPEEVLLPVCFIILSVFIWLPVSLCFKVIGKFFNIEVSGPLKFFGGMIFGGCYGFLLLSFVSQGLLLFPIDILQRAYQKRHSYTGRALARTLPEIQKVVSVPFQKKVKAPAAVHSAA